MNATGLLLIVLVFVIVFYAIYYIYNNAQTLYNLNTATPEIPYDKINDPQSTRYSYKMWVFVNSWGANQKVIIQPSGANGSPSNLKLYLDASTPTLNCDILTTDTTTPTKSVVITNNFPIQRWVYIVVSVDGSVVDCYLDGKLIRSADLGYPSKMDNASKANNNNFTIKFGVFDAFLTKFSRIAGATDPQTVWNEYMSGNGYESKLAPSYGFEFSVNKDKDIIAKYKY
jgi:hypothetical protein